MEYKHLFGPVPSRRFGRSLGVDLLPMKTCSFNCVFCQLGPTPQPTFERRAYLPVADVLDELKHWLATSGDADHITLAGSGEPTLHTQFGQVLQWVRENSEIPCVLLTNGSTLGNPAVRAAAQAAAVVKVSLSAWDQESLDRVNRPHPAVEFDSMFAGIRTFREIYAGRFWLEIVLLDGINTDPAAVDALVQQAAELHPDRIHLNTAVRPPADPQARRVSLPKLTELGPRFGPRAVIAAGAPAVRTRGFEATCADVLAMLQRRPCTAEQIAATLGLHRNELAKYLGQLTTQGEVSSQTRDQDVYYTANDQSDSSTDS